MQNERITFLREVPLLLGLGTSELEGLAAALEPRRYAAGETIFREGEAGRHLYFIESGRVRVYVLGEDGQEQSVRLMGRGDVVGELAVIDDGPRSASVVAVTSTRALALSRERFHALMPSAPQFMLNVLRLLSGRLRGTTGQLGSLVFLSVPERLARTLLGLAAEHGELGPEGLRLGAALNQSELASLVGASRESTNKALRALARAGLIRSQGGAILIPDLDALAAWRG